jgi:alkaline phosphatase D
MRTFIAFFILSFSLLSQSKRETQIQTCIAPFYHGVASGDPLHDRVIIWTRITPPASLIAQPHLVSWRVATDTGMVNIVKSGIAVTDSSMDFTVKVDVTGLLPNKFYFYEFEYNNKFSPRGRTKTAPLNLQDSLRFAVVSCANYEAGWFNVYAGLLAREDFDAVISLGDYIYEYNTGGYAYNNNVNRSWSPANEIVSIADYRMRYATYRTDVDLQRLHQQFPFIVVYDDHEFTNDAWMNGAQNHQSNEGPWSARKQVAQKAFFEWMPIRQTGTSNPYQIYRRISFGPLLEFFMLDTRIEGREQQAGTSGATVTNPNRQLLGVQQFNWLTGGLSNSTSQWKVLGQQVMMAPLTVFGSAVNGDQWDGYPAQRTNLYNYILNNNIYGVVVITGDIHSSWANDLPTSTYNSSNGAGSAGVEFVTPSVTSPGLSLPLGESAIMAANGHIKFCDLNDHGYFILDINQNRAQADWYFVPTIDNQTSNFTYQKSFYVNNLQRHLKSTNSAALPRASVFYTKAPLCPRTNVTTALSSNQTNLILFSAYPNPVKDYFQIQVGNPNHLTIIYTITDINGKVFHYEKESSQEVLLKKYFDTSELNPGVYFMNIEGGNEKTTFKFIKN